MKFVDVYNQYFDYVYRYLRQRVANSQDAEDISSEVWQAIWQHMDQFDNQKAVKPWISGICRHKLNDFLRKHYRFEAKFTRLEADLSPEEAIADGGSKSQLKPILLQLIDSLKEIDQQIIELKYQAQYSFAEIANELGITVGNVKVRHNRLLKKLKIAWENQPNKN